MPGLEVARLVPTSNECNRPKESEFFEPYAIFSRTLRTWLVAYGIGAPVLFASQQCFSRVLANPKAAIWFIGAFLSGVLMQVISAFLYKFAMWYLYFGDLHEDFRRTRRYRFSYWISEQVWLEMTVDLLSIVAFAWATAAILHQYLMSGS